MIFSNKKPFNSIIILSIISLLSIGYFGILMIKNNYQSMVELSINSNNDQSKLTNINRNFLRFILLDERSFSDVSSGKITIDSATNQLEYYKNSFLEDCEDSLISKKTIDSLFEKKIELLSKFNDVNNTHIKVKDLYVTDTTHKFLKIIGKSKISYKIDPKNLKEKIHDFDHDKINQSNKIILENFNLNFLMSQEVYKYSDKIKYNMKNNRNILIDNIDKSLNRFILIILVSIILMLLTVNFLIKRIS